MAKKLVKQSTRLVILFLYIGLLVAASLLALGQLPPTFGGKGLWFYTGIASLILGNLLITPFYTTPKDSLTNALLASLALYAANEWSAWGQTDRILFSTAIAYFAIIAIAAIGAILSKDSAHLRLQQIGDTLRIFCEELGDQRFVFSVVILFAVLTFHRDSPRETLVVMIAWIITVALKPETTILNLWERFKRVWRTKLDLSVIGDLVACQSPSLMLIRGNGSQHVKFGTSLLIKDPHDSSKCGVALDYIGRDDGPLLRVLELPISGEVTKSIGTLLEAAPDSSVLRIDDDRVGSISQDLLEQIKGQKDLVGVVSQDTTIERLFFEIVHQSDLVEGRLVGVNIGVSEVLYQVIGGLTKEEVVDRKNTFGYARGEARKIGTWDQEKGIFVRTQWMPLPNAAVRLKAEEEETNLNLDAVGHFPKTTFNVGIKSIDSLVTYNTAILGILGIGKTMLALELVERMLASEIRVVCLDLTNQYAIQLAEYFDETKESKKIEDLKTLGKAGKTIVKKNIEEGGSVTAFRARLKTDLAEFLKDEYGTRLKILNPSQFEVWKQDSKPFNETASMLSLTPTEITQIVSEVALELVQEKGMTDRARLCLIYEEAHSLVPEWNSVAAEGDKAATNGTARAILQGRKYGMGCLLITQRTANVTKSILNQCNTIFAMRTFDDTGKDFLSNYIGGDYAAVLPSLEERHAVFFGRASTCENPVLVRLNDQDDFRKLFRGVHPPPPLPVEIVQLAEEVEAIQAPEEAEIAINPRGEDEQGGR